MKVPKARKLPSGKWFIQLRLGGESIPITAITEKECVRAAELAKAEYRTGKKIINTSSLTLRQMADQYIDRRRNISSPATIRGYNGIRNNRFQTVMDKRVRDIRDWQKICDDESKLCSAKTLKNAWGFISSVLREAGEDVPNVRLGQVVQPERPYLEPEEIKVFISAVQGSKCEISSLLALHSLRRSEICALTWDNVDLKNRRIFVAGAAVYNEDNKLVQKTQTKNLSSRRYVPIMIEQLYDALQAVQDKTGLVVQYAPNTIRKQINRICAENNLPLVGIHGLRHTFATLAYHLNVPEKIAMQIGGWSNNDTMHKIYTHLAKKDLVKYEKLISGFFKEEETSTNG